MSCQRDRKDNVFVRSDAFVWLSWTYLLSAFLWFYGVMLFSFFFSVLRVQLRYKISKTIPATPSLLTCTSSSSWMMSSAAAQMLDGNRGCDVCIWWAWKWSVRSPSSAPGNMQIFQPFIHSFGVSKRLTDACSCARSNKHDTDWKCANQSINHEFSEWPKYLKHC